MKQYNDSSISRNFDSGIGYRIANPAVFRSAMQFPLNDVAYSVQQGASKNNDLMIDRKNNSISGIYKNTKTCTLTEVIKTN